MPKEFPFPILKHKELQEMLSTFLSVDVHVSELDKPTPERVQRVYEAVVATLLGPVQFDYSSLKWTEFPELYTEAAPRVAFFSRLQTIFNKLMVKDFCFEDLIRPEGSRFITQLSGLMNFLRFRAERLKILHECEQSQANISEERRELDEAIRKKRVELNHIQERHANERKEAESMEPEGVNRHQRCFHLSKSHEQLFNQLNGMKSKVNKLKDDLSAATFELNTKAREREHLEDQIVQSPSKIQAKIADLSSKLAETRSIATELLSRDTQVAEDLEAMQEMGKRLEEHMELLSQIETARAAKKMASKRKKEVREELEKSDTTYRQIVDEITRLGDTYYKTTLQLQSSIEQFEGAQRETEEALVENQQAKAQSEAENAEVLATVVAQGNDQIREWDARTQTLRDMHTAEMQKTVEKYKALEECFKNWCTKTQCALNDIQT